MGQFINSLTGERGNRRATVRRPEIKWEIYEDIDPFESTWLQKFTPRPGILVDTSEFAPVDFFYLFFPNEAFELISTETNRYAIQNLDSTADFEPSSRFHAWSDTSPDEIKAFVSLEIAMGLGQKPANVEYWSGAGFGSQLCHFHPLCHGTGLSCCKHFCILAMLKNMFTRDKMATTHYLKFSLFLTL